MHGDLDLYVGSCDGAVMVTATGLLNLPAALTLRKVLDKHLMDRGRVVVDVGELRLRRPSAAMVFPAALTAAGGWPQARLVLLGPDAESARTLGMTRVSSRVPVVADLNAACEALERRPPRVVRTTELIDTVRIGQHARVLVRTACEEWDLADQTAPAEAVATELATNAFVHGAGRRTMALAVDDRGLRISVHDDGPGGAVLTPGACGLLIVDDLSAAWGTAPEQVGKSVWATLRPSPGR